jgi:hypothetical protein
VKGMIMKILGYIAATVGVLLIIGVAGGSDYYEECRAAVDCVAGPAPTMAQMFLQLLGGVALLAGGSFWAYLWSE